ncbi:MAG: MerR family transcriptional regulator [Clostridiales bacterium]|nr:MerR family transcriptional regulator [Clostridiales bacterium]
MRYKIGEVARILGISTDLIRYYEEKGVVKPQKNRANRYRYYDAWDINHLIECIWYKKMGFGIEDIGRMSNTESYEELVARLTARSETLSNDIHYQQMLLARMRSLTDSVVHIKGGVGVCGLRPNREFLYYLNRRNEAFDNDPSLRGLNEVWSRYMPFTKRLFLVGPEALAGENDDYRWGYSIGMGYAEHFSVAEAPPVMKMEESQCIHAAFISHGKGDFTARRLDFMTEFAAENGLEPKGFAFGNLVCSVMEDGALTGYFEAWMPVEQG